MKPEDETRGTGEIIVVWWPAVAVPLEPDGYHPGPETTHARKETPTPTPTETLLSEEARDNHNESPTRASDRIPKRQMGLSG